MLKVACAMQRREEEGEVCIVASKDEGKERSHDTYIALIIMVLLV